MAVDIPTPTKPTAEAAAKLTVTNPPAAVPYTPIAVHIPVKTRAGMIQRINDLAPEGKPNPALLKAAKETALALIATFDDSVTGFDVKIETNAGKAAQLMVLVIPHEL